MPQGNEFKYFPQNELFKNYLIICAQDSLNYYPLSFSFLGFIYMLLSFFSNLTFSLKKFHNFKPNNTP